jgi:hypothetical protein
MDFSGAAVECGLGRFAVYEPTEADAPHAAGNEEVADHA